MNDEEMSDEKLNKVIDILTDRGLIKKLKNSNLINLTEKGGKEFAASALLCLDGKKQYKDAAEMKTAIIVLTILSTGKMEENLLLDTGRVFEIMIDETSPDFQEAIERVYFSQGDSCQPEK